jgi:hypothetical protein
VTTPTLYLLTRQSVEERIEARQAETDAKFAEADVVQAHADALYHEAAVSQHHLDALKRQLDGMS